MTDHVHEWSILEAQDIPHYQMTRAICDCDQELDLDEIERRLSATERLNAEDAMRILAMPIALGPRDDAYYKSLADKMRAYAAELEKE